MISALKQFGLTRWLALLVFGSVLIGCMVGFHRGWSSDGYRVPGALDISGEWEFYNGKLTPAEAQTKLFPFKVQVPKPLPPEIREKLAEEFWYRKRISTGSLARPLAISLGSIKGQNEIYWNGKFLGSSGKTGWVASYIPEEYSFDKEAIVTVRIQKYETLFPGIVSFYPIQLGDAATISSHLTRYYFELGLKPILAAAIKFIFAIFFICLFLATPTKREYLPFSIFALASACGAVCSSKFTPFYDDFYFKNALQFLFGSLTLSMIPNLTSAFLRLPNKYRCLSRAYGYATALVFLLATLQVKSSDAALAVYRLGNEWLPTLVGLPALVVSAYCYQKLDKKLGHRRRQIFVFGCSLLFGLVAWGSFATKYQSFQLFRYPEYLDLLVFIGLATSLILDFQVISRRSEKATRSIPKWFAGFLAAGTKEVKFEIPMIAASVDTIAYTKKLIGLSADEKDRLHQEIRELLMPLTELYGAQKLSDGGDGGIFAWDIPVSQESLQQVLNGVRYISGVQGADFKVTFRAGVAAGPIRCAMIGGDFSFMGDALNIAARLESMAKQGEPLLDRSVVSIVDGRLLENEWISAELKGVNYQGRALKKVA